MADNLVMLNAAARAAGMSYGQYVAMLYERSAGAGRSDDSRKRKVARRNVSPVELGAVIWHDPECPVCGREFVPKRKTQVCCSEACQKLYVRARERRVNAERYRQKHGVLLKQRVCPECGKVFDATHGSQKCCSKECTYARHLRRVEERNRRIRMEKEAQKVALA